MPGGADKTDGGVGRVTKAILLKALYLYCLEANVDWVMATARRPRDRQYDGLLLEDLYSGRFVPMRNTDDIPDRVPGFAIARPQLPGRIFRAKSSASFIEDEKIALCVRNCPAKGQAIELRKQLRALRPKGLNSRAPGKAAIFRQP